MYIMVFKDSFPLMKWVISESNFPTFDKLLTLSSSKQRFRSVSYFPKDLQRTTLLEVFSILPDKHWEISCQRNLL